MFNSNSAQPPPNVSAYYPCRLCWDYIRNKDLESEPQEQ